MLVASCGSATPDLRGAWILDPASVDGGRLAALEAARRGGEPPMDPATAAMVTHLLGLPADHVDAARLDRALEPLFTIDGAWRVVGTASALEVTAPGGVAWRGRLVGERLVLTPPSEGAPALRLRRR